MIRRGAPRRTPRPCPTSPGPSASPAGSGRSPSTPPRCAPSSACCPAAARSTPTPGSRTCASRRTSRGSTSPSPSAARSASTCPSRRSSRTSTPGWGPGPTRSCAIRIDQPPVRRVLARVADVPGFGWAPLQAGGARPPGHRVDGYRTASGLVRSSPTVSSRWPSTGTTGTFALDGIAGFGRLVDGGDHGDSYNYSPPARRPARGHARRRVGVSGRARARCAPWSGSRPATPGPTTSTA